MTWRVEQDECVVAMGAMDEASVDAIVTDPPYGLGFMGKAWDSLGGTGDFPMRRTAPIDSVNTGASRQGGRQRSCEDYAKRQARDARAMQEWHEQWSRQALRVLRPGGLLLAFGGTRTYHRLACGIEDAGFEVRDMVEWLYGQGFPKSKAALKPAHEPIVMARKSGPLAELNIDGCRIVTDESWNGDGAPSSAANGYGPGDSDGWEGSWTKRSGSHEGGRWPANVVLDEDAAAMLDEQTGELHSQNPETRKGRERPAATGGLGLQWAGSRDGVTAMYADSGGASRFFYCAKADTGEREAGLNGDTRGRSDDGYGSIQTPKLDRAAPRENWTPRERRNAHPTVKPIDLMRWLVRLVTPPEGTVLDPFTGSGTTGIATVLEGFDFIGIEREPEYVELARARIAYWEPQGWQMELVR